MSHKSEIKEISSYERELSIIVPYKDIQNEIDKSYRNLAKTASLRGFRKGKVPKKVLQQYYGHQVEFEALKKSVSNSYERAMVEHDLFPVAEPKIDFNEKYESGKDYDFKAKVEVKPNVVVEKWQGLKLNIDKFIVNEESVQNHLKKLQEDLATINPVTDRDAVVKTDIVNIDCKALVDGKPVRELTFTSQDIEHSSLDFFEKVYDAMEGKKIGDNIETKVQLPKSFVNTKFAEKEVDLDITIKSIKQRKLPALDDEFAKDVSDEYKTLQDLTNSIKEKMQNEANIKNDRQIKEAITTKIIEENKVDLPDSMIKKQAESMAMEMLNSLPKNQAQKYWAKQGPMMTKNFMPQAERMVKMSLMLESFINEKKLTATKQEVENFITNESKQSNMSKEQFKSKHSDAGIEFEIKTDKAFDLFKEHAQITYNDKPLLIS